jgi:hypothetical protein
LGHLILVLVRVASIVVVVFAAPRAAQACVFLEQEQQPQAQPPPQSPPPEPAPSLNFELLDESKPVAKVDEDAVRLRRKLLNLHQAVGLGMFALSLANTVVGQLNYSDRFASGPSTGKYQQAHQITAYTTVLAFAGTGLLALFAPTPLPKSGGIDRMTVHKLAMLTATAGMAAEIVLGILTAGREGYLNQPDFAAAHLVIGYATFAAISLGVGVIVF